MDTLVKPSLEFMRAAFMSRDAAYDGVFYAGVTSTGIFCRPSCPARRPRPDRLRFFLGPEEALAAGFRPCKRCRPDEVPDGEPEWIRALRTAVERDPARPWSDADLRAGGWDPVRVRRWFRRHYGSTFHAYVRGRRLAGALKRMEEGAGVASSGFAVGYDSLSGFQEAFRKYFGAPPSQVMGRTLVLVDRVPTPLGWMFVGASDDALYLTEFHDRRALDAQIRRLQSTGELVFAPGRNAMTRRTEGQLSEYFEGTRRRFTLPVRLVGTRFQKEVWEALCDIPYATTRSYGDVARTLGRPNAVRAVGRANGANALAVLVPCHRVVGADGRLTGYGGGVWRKETLLALEQRVAKSPNGKSDC